MRTRDLERRLRSQERAFNRLLRDFPCLYAVNNLWHYQFLPKVQAPTVEFFSQPFPPREKIEVWVHCIGGSHERVMCPTFDPHPTGFLGQVLYDHYVVPPSNPDLYEGELTNVILANPGGSDLDVERVNYVLILIPSRPELPLASFLTGHFALKV